MAQYPEDILYPAAIPLAVRSPYFSSWIHGTTAQHELNSAMPTFWDASTAGVRVPYNASIPANVTGLQITPTRSIFNLTADAVDFTITFLTPIDTSDVVLQSIPFSYVFFEARTNDGQPHSVQVYSDISGEWLSSNDSQTANWTTTLTDNFLYHQVQLQSPSALTEYNDQVEDATLYYAMSKVPGMTYRNGVAFDCRTQFEQFGYSIITQDTDWRAIGVGWEPAFAISVDLGNISQTGSPVVWTVGLIRDPVIMYNTSTGQSQTRSPYFRIAYETNQDVIGAFLSYFPSAMTGSQALDEQLMENAGRISPEYIDLISLASRQVMGSIDITIPEGTDGQWNTSDTKIFMKNLGVDRRVNPVETLYAAFPAFLYLNASLGGHLLAPLLEFQDSVQYNLDYAARDVGNSYPMALGDINQHDQGVEQSGNMLIMLLAHARASGDGTLLSNHYNLLARWAHYLIDESLMVYDHTTPDLNQVANQTNLAIKGIIGIQAMSEISRTLGKNDDAFLFANHSSTLVNQWRSLALSSSPNQSHILLTYGNGDSWSLAYNLYADVLLGTGLVDELVYTNQAQFYNSLFATSSATKFGLPISSDSLTEINSAWMLFAAAASKDATVQQTLIGYVHTRAALNATIGPFPAVYNAQSGEAISGAASPAQGAMFAPLALTVTNVTIAVPTVIPSAVPNTSQSNTRHHNVSAIAGGVVGGIVAALLCAAAFMLWRKKRRQLHQRIVAQMSTPFILTGAREDISAQAYPSEKLLSSGTNNRDFLQIPSSGFIIEPPLHVPIEPTVPAQLTPAQPTSHASSHTITSNSTSTAEILSPPVIEFRAELDDLRRQVQDILAERNEPPPTYVSDD